ncbi:hypothetical protein Q4525_15890, partial [Shimia thalassica]|uniref:hypothetical protein n=1 Tax=Shimia thalassica TaxID=1715693 RepID=UPI0026E2EBEE
LHKPQKFLPSLTRELPSAAPSGVPRRISAPPVKGVLRLLSKSRKWFFHISVKKRLGSHFS